MDLLNIWRSALESLRCIYISDHIPLSQCKRWAAETLFDCVQDWVAAPIMSSGCMDPRALCTWTWMPRSSALRSSKMVSVHHLACLSYHQTSASICHHKISHCQTSLHHSACTGCGTAVCSWCKEELLVCGKLFVSHSVTCFALCAVSVGAV